LLRKWTRKSLKGGRALILDVDYPEEGPKDIFALGVPKSVELPKHGQ
jgi:adenine-specific DNA methylase